MRRFSVVLIVLSIAFLYGCETTKRESKVAPSTESAEQPQTKAEPAASVQSPHGGGGVASRGALPNPAFGGGGRSERAKSWAGGGGGGGGGRSSIERESTVS